MGCHIARLAKHNVRPRTRLNASEEGDVNTWPGWECQVGILEGGLWWSTGGTAKLSPEHILKYTIFQASINTQGGGTCWAADPYTDGTWEPDVTEYLTMTGALL